MEPGGGPDLPAARESAVAQLGRSPKRHLYRGRDPKRASSIEDLRAMAHRRLPRFALEYLEAGAEDEGALAGNLAAFAKWRFLPQALKGAKERNLSSTLFGRDLPFPLIVAPTGLNGVFRYRADSILAAGAAEMGVPFTQSCMSNERVEEVGRVPGLRHWVQLYVMERDDITDGLIASAERAGCEALVVTTDAQLFGKRSWSARERTDPTTLGPGAVLDAALHVPWLLSTLLPAGMPRFRNFDEWLPKGAGLFESAFWIRERMDVGLDWDRMKRIRDRWQGPLLIKGILAADDVVQAAELGADAVVLSNHGGRQLDWAAAPLDMLPAAREAAGDRIKLLMDGGIRTGGDAIKALALGADAVMVGRAPLYGLAGAGVAGVVRALEILNDEIDRDLAFLGCGRIADLSPDFLVRE